MIKNLFMFLVFLLLGSSASAANHYIYSGATGSHNGTDWTNAWTSLSQVTLTRGDVYYIAAGSYGSFTFTGGSGTSAIEFRGAIGGSGDHGTSTGWNDSFQGQAIFGNGGARFTDNYWIVNGQAVPGCSYPSNDDSCYTIKFENPAAGSSPTADQAMFLCDNSTITGCTDYTLEYVDVLGSNTTDIGGNFTDEGIKCALQCTNVLFDHDYIHQVGCDLLSFNEYNGATLTIQYSWLAYNDVGLGNISGSYAHCQGIQSTIATMTIKYNVWQDMQSSGAITLAAGGAGAPITEWDVYGNLFFWDDAWIAAWTGNGSVGYDDGIVGFFDLSAPFTGVLKFYNNTITSPGLALSQNCKAWAYTINAGETVTATIENNIWYNFDSTNCQAGASGAGTYDYNAYYNVSAGVQDSGTNSYSSGTYPFVDPTQSNIWGFQLDADTQVGDTLASPFNTDMLGLTRGAGGVWDIGAFQADYSSSILIPPLDLSLISVQ